MLQAYILSSSADLIEVDQWVDEENLALRQIGQSALRRATLFPGPGARATSPAR